MLKTSIESAAYFGAYDYEIGLAKMHEHGFNCVDYTIAGEPVDRYSDEEYFSYLKSLKNAAKENQIGFFQAHGNRDTISLVDGCKMNDFLLRQLITCSELECEYLVLHPYTDGYILNADSHETIFQKNLDFFQMLLPYAKRYGITICVENLPFRWYEMCRVTEVKKLLKTINDENCKACFDTGHANVMRENIYDSIKLLGQDLKVLHLHDNYGTEDDRHYLPYRGNVNWEGFIKALKEIGYQGSINLETRISIETPEPMRDMLRQGLANIAKYFAEKIGN